MRKFKLVREYPGSPKLGYITNFNSNDEDWNTPNMLILLDCINYPEFWEEIKEFPKIVSFRSLHENTYDVLLKYDGEKCISRSDEKDPKYTISFSVALKDPKCEIYQVAISETEVFTLGDEIIIDECSPTYNKGIIKYFKVAVDGHIRVEISNECNVGIQKIKKAPKVLFTTEDGGEILEVLTRIWGVSEDFKIFNERFWDIQLFDLSKYKIYATKEAAEKYVDENKPIYSKKQIREAIEKSSNKYMKCATLIVENTFNQELNL